MLGTQRQGNKAIHMLRLLDMEKASGSTEATFTMPAEKFRKYDCLKDFLCETYELVYGGVYVLRPHIFCEDGFEMSVQPGSGSYSAPREDLESGEYTACEVSFPNRKEELLMPSDKTE